MTENGTEKAETITLPGEVIVGEDSPGAFPDEETPVEDIREWNLRITIEATIDSAIGRGKSTREIIRHETIDIVKGDRLNEIIECVTPKS